MKRLRVTFGMIVLNGHPFLKYNLESLYPFAHEIIVVEGACPAAKATARPDGHSLDGTFEFLTEFAVKEDPDKKIRVVTAAEEGHSDGFWPEKMAMSQAYAKRATGEVLWQIDVDEFYKPEDMENVIRKLSQSNEIRAVSFNCLYFWGGLGYVMDGFSFRTGDQTIHRVFTWDRDSRYTSHRPPTVVDGAGRDLKSLRWLSDVETKKMGIHLYHYDMILPKQAANKSSYYSNVDWHTLGHKRVLEWKQRVFDRLERPFHIYTIYTHLSWLKRYRGAHPPAVERMVRDIQAGLWPGSELRRTDDIEAVLESWRFRLLLPFVKVWASIQVWAYGQKLVIREKLLMTSVWRVIQKLRGRPVVEVAVK